VVTEPAEVNTIAMNSATGNLEQALSDDGTQIAPRSIAGPHNLSEGDSLSCELSRHGAA
jgi:hypothetical protein